MRASAAGLLACDSAAMSESALSTEYERAERRLSVQYAVARVLAESPTLAEATPQILQAIAEALGWDVGELWTVDRRRGTLRNVDVWHSPSLAVPEFKAATQAIEFAPGEGLPGRVWALGEAVWLPDMAQEADFPRAGAAAREGLHASLGFPIVLAGEFLGVMAFFSGTIEDPDEELLRMMASIGSQIGQFVERRVAEEAVRESEARKTAILEAALDCVISIDHEGRIIEFNPAAERTFGHARAEVIGREMAEVIIPPDLRDLHRTGLARYLETGEGPILGQRLELRAVRSDGSEFPVELTVTRVEQPGRPFFTGYVRDITERKRAEDALRFLAEASTVLASSLDYETTLERVAQLAVPRLADWCAIDIVEGDALRRLAVAHVDPAKVELAREIERRYPTQLDAEAGPPRVIRTGASELIPEIPDKLLVAATQDEEHLRIARELGLKSVICVPLLTRGRRLGAISLVSAESGRTFNEHDLAFAEELARRASIAVDNARLYRQAHAEARRAERLVEELAAKQEQLELAAEASRELSSSLDFERTLQTVVGLAVPRFADGSSVYLLDEAGAVERFVAHYADPEHQRVLEEIWRRYGSRVGAANPLTEAIRGRRSLLAREVTDEAMAATAEDAEHLALMGRLGIRSLIAVPLVVGGRTIGALTFSHSTSGRRFDDADLAFAEELGRRCAVAIENARLYAEAGRRARAAQALESVGDGVFLVDREGIVRLWNPAAAAITGLPADEVVGSRVADAFPGWLQVVERIHVATSPGPGGGRAETIPFEFRDGERWLSITAVEFPEGTVYAFRDLTEERALERLKSEFVSTVSHELRTPLAAIYGASVTLRRSDVSLAPEQRDALLNVITSESDRLARTVNDILWASRVDATGVELMIESCDPLELARRVVDAAGVHVPQQIELRLSVADSLPAVAADPDKVSQVLANLVENAIKYSPDGGCVDVSLEAVDGSVRFSVRDEGLGIPPAEQSRIFEKFYRLDPNLTRGVGGTGLGLYIVRELVRMMGGRIWVASEQGRGSTFSFELPVAG